MELSLVRHAYLPEITLGWLTAGSLRVATLEEAWRPDPDGPGGQRREGKLRESCVPDGRYELFPHSGELKKDVWSIRNTALGIYYQPGEVPPGQRYGRTAILIHVGNTLDDTLGCILVGLQHGKVRVPSREGPQEGVIHSLKAVEALRQVLGKERHTLVIRPTSGTSELT